MKNDILDGIVSNLKLINGSSLSHPLVARSPYTFNLNIYNKAIRGFKYLDQINSFPYICVSVINETRAHIGAGEKYGIVNLLIRGYLKGNTSFLEAEDLADDIEFILEYTAKSYNNDLVDIKISSFATDEGLLTPYAICDINANFIYCLQ